METPLPVDRFDGFNRDGRLVRVIRVDASGSDTKRITRLREAALIELANTKDVFKARLVYSDTKRKSVLYGARDLLIYRKG
jgi:hypothetical protein